MQLKAEALPAQLARGPLAAVYTVAGDDPLLAIEAQDAVRAAARRAGHLERTVLHADGRTDWSLLQAATGALSLFGERRLVEVRLPGGRPGKEGAAALQALAAAAGEGLLALVALPRLDRATRDSAWANALADAGVWVDVLPIDRAQLPAWLAQRLAAQQQRAAPAALEFLADRVEGNLLAARQEILKLGLLHPAGELGLEAVADSVLHVARYDAFGLPGAALAGDPVRAARMVEGLRAAGEALPLVLWSVAEELRALLRVRAAVAAGRPFATAARENRIWPPRAARVERVLPRLDDALLLELLDRCADIDRLGKGLGASGRDSDPWLELRDVVLQLTRACAAAPVRSTAVPRGTAGTAAGHRSPRPPDSSA